MTKMNHSSRRTTFFFFYYYFFLFCSYSLLSSSSSSSSSSCCCCCCWYCHAFVIPIPTTTRTIQPFYKINNNIHSTTSSFFFSSLKAQKRNNNNNNNGNNAENKKRLLLERIRNKQIIDFIVTNGIIQNYDDSRSAKDYEVSSSSSSSSSGGGGISTRSFGTIEMNFAGIGNIGRTGPNNNYNTKKKEKNENLSHLELADCLFLIPSSSSSSSSSTSSSSSSKTKTQPCIPIPLPTSKSKPYIQLLSYAYNNKPISKSTCLLLSPTLINRDGSLYDNLPWTTWTIDNTNNNQNKRRNVDAAGNNIDSKYHLGKRDAYNRFMGKDWIGRSVSLGNVAARIKYLLENENDDDNNDDDYVDSKQDDMEGSSSNSNNNIITLDENAKKILARRVLELEVKEARMGVASAEEQLAIIRVQIGSVSTKNNEMSDDVLIQNYDLLQNAIRDVNDAQSLLEEYEQALSVLSSSTKEEENDDEDGHQTKGKGKDIQLIVSLLDMIIESQKSPAPYRGAIGYKPVIDSKEEIMTKSTLPYSSPYELMTEILNEQLNAKVIGCIIENTSLFNGSIVLGGALVLQRKTVQKQVLIDGESVLFDDSEDNLGNEGISSGDIKVVECDCDEVIGMAMANGLCINVERDIWEHAQIICTVEDEGPNNNEIFPKVNVVDRSIILKTQGDGEKSIGTPILIPRESNDSFRNFLSSSGGNQAVFDTKIPVASLTEYDQMTVQDKAQMLLSLDSFKGKLPRPRELRQAKNESGMDPLDQMLIPLIDESVRRQILAREARRRGDMEEARNLDREKSMRQIAKENAQKAKDDGNTELALAWENEAEFYASLRADVTQDEGSYSSFLDRDEWYERNRRAVAERNKKRFGSLFDGLQE